MTEGWACGVALQSCAQVLSLGEQQRLQFCRLFWHYDWHKEHGRRGPKISQVMFNSCRTPIT